MTDYTMPDLEERLQHLPPRKRRELAFIVKILFEEFQPSLLPKASKALRNSRILKIILFGSYARGGWKEDRKSGYNSDYDLLIVVNKEEAADPEHWYHLEGQLLREELVTKRIKTPVELIVHSYHDINAQLSVGRPFFLDILLDGIALYEEPGFPLRAPGYMSPELIHREAQKYFDKWHKKSKSALRLAKIAFNEAQEAAHGSEQDAEDVNEYLCDAAFLAHQATERIYHCLLLSLTLYSPKLHNLRKLRSLANAHAPQLASVWPVDKRAYKRCFELLRRAYVEARYSPEYKITEVQLQWLFGRIEDLQERVKQICEEYLRG